MTACHSRSSHTAGSSTLAATTPAPEGTTSAPEEVQIQTSLDGVLVIPERFRWWVRTSLPLSDVSEVLFRIDKEPYWIDRSPPYVFPGGSKALTWVRVRPGMHRFSVRVLADNGSVWRKSVAARGQRVPGTMNRIWAIWGRVSPGAGSQLQLYSFYFTVNSQLAYGYPLWREGNVLHVGPPTLSHREIVSSGWRFKGRQCPPASSADYTYSYRRTRTPKEIDDSGLHTREFLTLSPRREPCERRRRVLEGVFAALD